jgi:hypothetical protein
VVCVNIQDYKEGCKKGMGDCPPQCMSSVCPNLNLGEYNGEPKNYPQDSFCNCPYRKKKIDTLDIITAWINYWEREKSPGNYVQLPTFHYMVKELKANPQLVIERGRKEGWLL